MKIETPNTLTEKITTSLWFEIADSKDPFRASRCFCAGYDVYGDLIKHATWIEYIFLLFKKEPPTEAQTRLLNGIAIAIGNPGPRDSSARAAMCAGVGGSSMASSLMAALAVGAGNLGGGQEVLQAMKVWQQCGRSLKDWGDYYTDYSASKAEEKKHEQKDVMWEDVWPPMEHPAGFYPYGKHCAKPVLQTLHYLANIECASHLPWLKKKRHKLEKITGMPLSFVGVVAAAFIDLNLDPEQGEMLYLLLRLPGTAAHALEQRELGWKNYPFHHQGLTVLNDPLSRKERSNDPITDLTFAAEEK